MRLIYFIQVLFLLSAFLYGYWANVNTVKVVLFSVVNQFIYSITIYILYTYFAEILSVFDLFRLEKEWWLVHLIQWLSGIFGHSNGAFKDLSTPYYYAVGQIGGLFFTITLVLAGSLLSNAMQHRRVAIAKRVNT